MMVMTKIGWSTMRKRVAHAVPRVDAIHPVVTSKCAGLTQQNVYVAARTPAREIDQTRIRNYCKFDVRVLLIRIERLVTTGVTAMSVPPVTIALKPRLVSLVSPPLRNPIAVVKLDVRSIDRQS